MTTSPGQSALNGRPLELVAPVNVNASAFEIEAERKITQPANTETLARMGKVLSGWPLSAEG
ncbi:hypothetical protein K2X89_04430, partial [Myxococcota bacterium]|nr:hypothetical protein [Myxococcota bacterium]